MVMFHLKINARSSLNTGCGSRSMIQILLRE